MKKLIKILTNFVIFTCLSNSVEVNKKHQDESSSLNKIEQNFTFGDFKERFYKFNITNEKYNKKQFKFKYYFSNVIFNGDNNYGFVIINDNQPDDFKKTSSYKFFFFDKLQNITNTYQKFTDETGAAGIRIGINNFIHNKDTSQIVFLVKYDSKLDNIDDIVKDAMENEKGICEHFLCCCIFNVSKIFTRKNKKTFMVSACHGISRNSKANSDIKYMFEKILAAESIFVKGQFKIDDFYVIGSFSKSATSSLVKGCPDSLRLLTKEMKITLNYCKGKISFSDFLDKMKINYNQKNINLIFRDNSSKKILQYEIILKNTFEEIPLMIVKDVYGPHGVYDFIKNLNDNIINNNLTNIHIKILHFISNSSEESKIQEEIELLLKTIEDKLNENKKQNEILEKDMNNLIRYECVKNIHCIFEDKDKESKTLPWISFSDICEIKKELKEDFVDYAKKYTLLSCSYFGFTTSINNKNFDNIPDILDYYTTIHTSENFNKDKGLYSISRFNGKSWEDKYSEKSVMHQYRMDLWNLIKYYHDKLDSYPDLNKYSLKIVFEEEEFNINIPLEKGSPIFKIEDKFMNRFFYNVTLIDSSELEIKYYNFQ